VTSDPACIGATERIQANQPSMPLNGCCRKSRMREDNRYPPEPETDPGEEETRSYQTIAARPMHMVAYAA